MERREFIETSIRTTLIGGLAVLTFFLSRKQQKIGTCAVNPTCNGCRVYNECNRKEKQ